jgi:hypothetical protein
MVLIVVMCSYMRHAEDIKLGLIDWGPQMPPSFQTLKRYILPRKGIRALAFSAATCTTVTSRMLLPDLHTAAGVQEEYEVQAIGRCRNSFVEFVQSRFL